MAVTEYKLQCGICTLLKLECKMQLSLMKYGNLLLEKQQAVGCTDKNVLPVKVKQSPISTVYFIVQYWDVF